MVGEQNATEISDFSHRNVGWEHAFDEGSGRSPQPISWSLALQQIVDEDPWLERDATAQDEEVFTTVERGEVVEWV